MTYDDFYGSDYASLKWAEQYLLDLIAQYPDADPDGVKAVIYCSSRIKSPKSMLKKLKKQGLPATKRAALDEIYDAVGVRIICSFAEEVYRVVEWLRQQSTIEIVQEKDYIAYPKPNGYRSLHLQIRLQEEGTKCVHAELQVRTIAIDFWATLEHQIKYKKNIAHEELIRSELKRCADEIASVDLSMQTIRDIIKTV